jgi:hypothetical protein
MSEESPSLLGARVQRPHKDPPGTVIEDPPGSAFVRVRWDDGPEMWSARDSLLVEPS